MQKIELLFQHPDFIIIYKPYGISVHKDNEEIGLTAQVAEMLGVPQVWLVHRLDKTTSGLLILALNSQSAAEFSRLFAEHQIHKTYLALSQHKPKKKQGLIIGDMKKLRQGAWKLCQTKVNPAITRFSSLSCEPHLRLFILHPESGKTHQLRVAMKSLGSPILGDELYGKTKSQPQLNKTQEENAINIDRTYLHAFQLDFVYQGKRYCCKTLPKEGKWWEKETVIEKIRTIKSIEYGI